MSQRAVTDPPTYETDLLVIGAGMAGLTAAGAAAQQGAEVLVVEKGPEVGGSAALSGGLLWSFDTFATLASEIPLADPTLGRTAVECFPRLVDWVKSLHIDVADRAVNRNLPDNSAYLFDVLGYLRRCRALVERAGGHVMTNVSVEALETERGRVRGARVNDGESTVVVRARWTLLATGGFQADPDLVRGHVGVPADRLLLRSNPRSTGDGLRLGTAVGAAHSDSMSGFYGHLVAFPLQNPFGPSDYARLAHSYSAFAVLLDRSGRRFVDESSSYHLNAQTVARLTEPRAVLVGDAAIRANYAAQPSTPGMEMVDKVTESAAAGAHAATAPTLGQLAEAIASWGYDGTSALDTLSDYNRRIDDLPDSLVPPRSRHRWRVAIPPFFAVELQPAITFTHGGLRIDERARVLDEHGSPIPGLLAAGVDGAGVHNVGYAGGLGVSGVFGLRAAETALE